MNEAKSEFEADLESAMGLDAEPGQPATSSQPAETPAPPQTTIEAGGRRFKDVSELSKSYGSLWSEYSKAKQDFSKAKNWLEFERYLEKHPSLRDKIRQEINSYHSQSSGQPASQKRDDKVSPDYEKRLVDLESRLEDAQLQREIEEVRSTFKLSDEDMQKVLAESHKHNGIPSSVAARSVLYDRMSVDAHAEAEQKVKQDVEKKRNANVGPSANPRVAPAPKNPAQMDGKEFDAAMDRELESYGIR